jgi:hypothetical protein
MTAKFLVDDALQILSSLSKTHIPPDTPSSSAFVRLLWGTLEFLKSLSFIQYTSLEESVSSGDPRSDSYKKAIQLLSKAAESENSDAMYLLGELNFVQRHTNLTTDHSTETIQNPIIARLSPGSRK